MKRLILITLFIISLTLSAACGSGVQENSNDETNVVGEESTSLTQTPELNSNDENSQSETGAINEESNDSNETPVLNNEQPDNVDLLMNNDIVEIDGDFTSEIDALGIEMRNNDSSDSESPISIISAAAYANDDFIYVCAEYNGDISSTFVIELTIKYDDSMSSIFFPMSNGASSSRFNEQGMNDYTSGIVALNDSMIECLLPKTDFQGNFNDDIVSLKVKDDGEVIEEILIHWS